MSLFKTVVGTWNAVIATPIGKQSVVFEISIDAAGGLYGVATDKHGAVTMRNLTLQDDRLTWLQHVTKPLRLSLVFDVVVEDSAMQGIAKAGALPSSRVSAVRNVAQDSQA